MPSAANRQRHAEASGVQSAASSSPASGQSQARNEARVAATGLRQEGEICRLFKKIFLFRFRGLKIFAINRFILEKK